MLFNLMFEGEVINEVKGKRVAIKRDKKGENNSRIINYGIGDSVHLTTRAMFSLVLFQFS